MIALPADGPVVLVDPDPAVDVTPFAEHDIVAVTGFRPAADALEARGIATRRDMPARAGLVVRFLPRSRPRAMDAIARGLDALPPGGWLVVDGPKGDGIDSVLKTLGTAFGPLDRVARDHGKAGWLCRPESLPPEVAAWRMPEHGTGPEDWITGPGMFSADAVDPGSALLMDALPEGLKGRAADLGAGWGALSRGLLARNPGITHLDLVEADHASTLAARENVVDTRAQVHWADALGWKATPYDIIVMNPPFHTSAKGDPGIGAGFIDAAARLLAPSGHLFMVANRHLPYEDRLSARFRDRVEIGGDSRYKIYRASRPVRK